MQEKKQDSGVRSQDSVGWGEGREKIKDQRLKNKDYREK
jgi:hypothetical protein